MSAGAALAVRALTKRFGGAVALDGVSLEVAPGEVHGLLGSNGSGKSTLIKILAGFHTPEPGGEVRLYGEALPLPVPGAAARARGLAFVHQNLGLIPSLSVAENLNLGRLASASNWRLDFRRLEREAAETFARFGLALDPRAETRTLSAVEQALLAIVRAHEDMRAATQGPDRPGVLVLDEPTPFLPRAGVDQLFDLVRRCTGAGASVVFVSHDVDEVREITDRASILRDGRLVGTVRTADLDHAGFVERIVGRRVARADPPAPPAAAAPLATVAGLAAPGLGPVDLHVAPGEVLGLAGLVGAGYDRVAAALSGALPGASGTLTLGGDAVDLARLTPAAALARGLAYLPADRLGAAGVGSLSVADNVALPILDRLRARWGLSARRLEAHAEALGAAARVRPNAPALPLSALSGGNAQKVVLAKWMQTRPRLLLLDEPTQGVDVGARAAIWEALRGATAAGAAVIVASTDYDQLAAICHRVLILARGRVVAELAGAALTKEEIAALCYRSGAGRAA